MNREKLLGRRPKVEAVQYDGETYHVRAMNGAERLQFGKDVADEKSGERIALIVVARVVCDPDGNPLLMPEDVDQLTKVDGGLFEALATAALRLNGIGNSAVEDAKKN